MEAEAKREAEEEARKKAAEEEAAKVREQERLAEQARINALGIDAQIAEYET